MQLEKAKETKQDMERCRLLAQRIAEELAPATAAVLNAETPALEKALHRAGVDANPFTVAARQADLLVVEDPAWVEMPAQLPGQVLLVFTGSNVAEGWAEELARRGYYRDFRWRSRGRAQQGANTIRLAHYQHSQDFYDACDELGFAVWAEIPFISVFKKDPSAHQNCRHQMTELIIQNYNHPSIMFWGLSNEILIGGICQELVDNHHDLQKLVRELDPTRLTTIAHVSNTPVDGPMHHITDVESYNHYFGWYGGKMEQNGPWLDKFHAEHPDICIGISEYGTEGIINWHSNDPQCKDYTEEYQALYHEHLAQVFEDRPWVWATHCWNMFDFGCAARNEGGVAGRNNKGLMTIDRKTKKDSYFVYQAYWSKQPMVHIAGRRHAQRAGETTEIKVYSNQDTVVLYVNGKEVGQQTAHRVFKFNVALEEGFNTILAVAGDVKDSITLEKVEKEPDCYTLPEFNERQEGVANWFKQVGSLDLKAPMEFPEGYYSIKDSMEDLSKNEEALALATRAVKLATNFDIKPGVGMWDMMKRMTPETMAKMINMPDGFIESLNAQLIKIKK